MKYKVKAPARIDLAGGTLDLWPLYLFFENTATINCTIDQYAEVEVEVGTLNKTSNTPTIELISLDRNASHFFHSYGECVESFQNTHKAISLPASLQLHARVVRHFLSLWRRTAPIKITTKCASPLGAGLGGSSALNIALCVALRKITLANYSDEELIALARDLETTVIDVPAGEQDYWSALFGGVQAIRMDFGRKHRKVFYKHKDFVQSQTILCYSGQSRNSGINNWSVYKKFIDGDGVVREAFKDIVKATALLEESLESFSYEKFWSAINQEWEARQKLAPTIATDSMLNTINFAKSKGAKAAKVCGAGGGGCFIIVCEPDKKEELIQLLRKQGSEVIDFNIVEKGCEVDEL
jgi:D-glycero-alpha-D-manno-heptose-7-phosphate kinase